MKVEQVQQAPDYVVLNVDLTNFLKKYWIALLQT